MCQQLDPNRQRADPSRHSARLGSFYIGVRPLTRLLEVLGDHSSSMTRKRPGCFPANQNVSPVGYEVLTAAGNDPRGAHRCRLPDCFLEFWRR